MVNSQVSDPWIFQVCRISAFAYPIERADILHRWRVQVCDKVCETEFQDERQTLPPCTGCKLKSAIGIYSWPKRMEKLFTGILPRPSVMSNDHWPWSSSSAVGLGIHGRQVGPFLFACPSFLPAMCAMRNPVLSWLSSDLKSIGRGYSHGDGSKVGDGPPWHPGLTHNQIRFTYDLGFRSPGPAATTMSGAWIVMWTSQAGGFHLVLFIFGKWTSS